MDVVVENVRFRYQNGTEALGGVDLTVRQGTVHAIVGPSGCGKSTLLRVIGGVSAPSSGQVRFVGEPHHAHRTAMVFQTPSLLDRWTVDRNVGMSAEFRRVKEPLYTKTVRYITERLGLRHLSRRPAGRLSVGEKTRVAFGRAFVHDADVMLLDEPFGSLDAITRRKMWEELETHWQIEPRTYLLVTHDIEEAIVLSDQVSVMTDSPGRIAGTVTVDLPRPRGINLIGEPGFRSARSQIWDFLGESAR